MNEEDQIDMMHDSHALWQEIDRLRAELAAAKAEVAKSNAERDEARREVCRLIAFGFDGPKGAARQRGWDCFKEAKR
jgi:hypothetical protein